MLGVFARYLVAGTATRAAAGAAKQLGKFAARPGQFRPAVKKVFEQKFMGFPSFKKFAKVGPETTFREALKKTGKSAWEKAAPFAVESVAIAGVGAVAIKGFKEAGGVTLEGNATDIERLDQKVEDINTKVKTLDKEPERDIKDKTKEVEVKSVTKKADAIEQTVRELTTKTNNDYESIDKRLDALGG